VDVSSVELGITVSSSAGKKEVAGMIYLILNRR
jgi:hypothetical protein